MSGAALSCLGRSSSGYRSPGDKTYIIRSVDGGNTIMTVADAEAPDVELPAVAALAGLLEALKLRDEQELVQVSA